MGRPAPEPNANPEELAAGAAEEAGVEAAPPKLKPSAEELAAWELDAPPKLSVRPATRFEHLRPLTSNSMFGASSLHVDHAANDAHEIMRGLS